MVPETLTNMNVFVDGKGLAGVATSLDLPKLKMKTDDARQGGMDAPVKQGLGLEAIEASFSTKGIQTEVLKFFGLASDNGFSGFFRGSFKDINGNVKSAVATFRGMLTEEDPGTWKAGEANETKFSIGCTYYKLEIDGAVIYDLDPINGIRIINGVDQTAAERAAIGM